MSLTAKTENMKEIIKEISYTISSALRRLCWKIAPSNRLTVIFTMTGIFFACNLYFIGSSLYNWGKQRNQLKIEHIQRLPVGNQEDRKLYDSEIEIEQENDSSINYQKTSKKQWLIM